MLVCSIRATLFSTSSFFFSVADDAMCTVVGGLVLNESTSVSLKGLIFQSGEVIVWPRG